MYKQVLAGKLIWSISFIILANFGVHLMLLELILEIRINLIFCFFCFFCFLFFFILYYGKIYSGK